MIYTFEYCFAGNAFCLIYRQAIVICLAALTMVQTASTTLLQENSAPEMVERIFGLFGAAYFGFLPIGMVVFGLLTDRISMRLLIVASGVLLILLATVMFLDKSFYRRSRET